MQYYRNLSQKLGEDQKKRSSPQIRTDFGKTKQKKVLVLDLFICQQMLTKLFPEEINHVQRPCGPHKTASRAKCGLWTTGWAALAYAV